MDRGGPTGCAVAGSQSRTVPSSNPAATRPPSPRNAAQVAGDGGGQEPGENRSGGGIAELDRAVPYPASGSTTVGTEPSGGLVDHRLADRRPRVVSHRRVE